MNDQEKADKAKEGADTKAAPPADTKTVSDTELQSMITKAVSDGIAGVTKDYAKVPTAEDIGKIVTKSLAEAADKRNVEEITSTAMRAALDECKKPSKFEPSGKTVELNRNQAEFPTSWEGGKDNLPLHGMQLLNILMNPDMPGEKAMNIGISEAIIRKGKALGDRMLDSFRMNVRTTVQSHKSWGAAYKALAEGSFTGDQGLVPTDLAAELQRQFYLQTPLATLFAGREINMPSETYNFPLRTTLGTLASPIFTIGGTGTNKTESSDSFEYTAVTAVDPGFSYVSLKAVEFVGEADVSYALEEDSIIPALPLIQETMAQGAAHAYESALINGDSTGTLGSTHFDSGDIRSATRHPAKAWKGFRRLAYDVASLMYDCSTADDITWDVLMGMRKAMGIYGLDPKGLIWVCGPSATIKMANISYARTVEQYGQGAVVLQGQVDQMAGTPIVASQFMREALNASGVYDGATTTKGAFLLLRPDQFLTGSRRQFQVETWRDIKKRQTVVVASFRRAFSPLITPAASVQSVVCGYNWTA